MARAETYTWLPLDEWAKIFGYSRWTFNSIGQPPCQVGSGCNTLWFQEPEQYDTVSREELASAICDAEQIISSWVNFNLLPDWNVDVLTPARFYIPEYLSPVTNIHGRAKSIQVDRRKVRELGTQTKTEIEADVSITYVDTDGDGFFETGRITVAGISGIDVNEIRVYYPGESGADEWEIRPIVISGTTIEFMKWQVVKPELQSPLCVDALDYLGDIYLDEVDVYQVSNTTTNAIDLVYEPLACGGTSLTSLASDGFVRNHKLGFVVYNPNLWNEPDTVEVNYYSGHIGRTKRPLVEIDPYWARAIAYLAISILDIEPDNCAGSSTHQLISMFRQDIALSERTTTHERLFRATQWQLENPFAITTKGAWYAYNKARSKRIP